MSSRSAIFVTSRVVVGGGEDEAISGSVTVGKVSFKSSMLR
jgi:hypothetical protein